MIQVVKYKCCGNIFAACCEPDCYTDKDWLKNLKKYVNRGDKVEMVESGNLVFGECGCQVSQENTEPNLFSSLENDHQPEKSKLETQQEQLRIPVVMRDILVKLIKDAYFKGYDDGYSVMYNEEFVGEDKILMKDVDGVDKVVEDVMKKYCV